MRSSKCGIPLLLSLGFVSALLWAEARDPYKRVEFALKTPTAGKFKGIAVLRKPSAKYPIVVYIHGSGGSLSGSGKELRQIADLGLAAVGIEYDQTSQEVFDEQFITLQEYLKKQSWAQSDAVAWVGLSLGAQRTLSFLLKYPDVQPQLLVRLAGGWIPELNQFADPTKQNVRLPIRCPVLLVHGEKDTIFPVRDAKHVADFVRDQKGSVTTIILPDKNHGFDADRALVLRVVSEYCRSILAPTEPFTGVSKKSVKPLWIYLSPTFMGLGLLFFWKLRERRAKREGIRIIRTKLQVGLRWLALGLVFLALGESAFHLVTPEFGFSQTTSTIALGFLVEPECREDFAFLSTNSIWRGRPLKTLLEHAVLANYNRKLVNWRLKDKLYREFVLSTAITGNSSDQLDWRRPLWEEFYPRIRHESSVEDATKVVARHLRERVTITAAVDLPHDIPTIWSKQIADEGDFEVIYIAVLRSVGVAARLDSQKKAEFWDGDKWRTASSPSIVRMPAGSQN